MKHESNHPHANAVTCSLSPERSAAEAIHRFAGIDPDNLTGLLEAQGNAAAMGDFEGARRSLAAQVTTLERMFLHFCELAMKQPTGSDPYERLMRLSLRAQLQCARTVAILGRLSDAAPAEQDTTQATGAQADPNEPLGSSPERTDWLPETCGPDCASHQALKRMTRWANKSPVAIGMLTRRMNGDGYPAETSTEVTAAAAA